MFHNMLFGKLMELLKVHDDSSSFEGILTVYNDLSEILLSDLTSTEDIIFIIS